MSRYLILGDLHCRETWKDIVAKEGDTCDKIIFLGDYTCPKDVIFRDPTDACGFLYDVLDYKDRNSDKVILLRGNHDIASLGYYWAQCYPQDHPKVQEYWQTADVKNWFLRNTQWIYQIPDTNIVCSHAGISDEFLKNVEKYLVSHGSTQYNDDSIDAEVIIGLINSIEPCELFGFTSCRMSDNYGESATQPCTWIRPYTLLQYSIKDYIQVVGHTPIKHICNLKEGLKKDASKYDIDENIDYMNDYADIWCCDNLQNGEYLIIEDGIFKPCKI